MANAINKKNYYKPALEAIMETKLTDFVAGIDEAGNTVSIVDLRPELEAASAKRFADNGEPGRVRKTWRDGIEIYKDGRLSVAYDELTGITNAHSKAIALCLRDLGYVGKAYISTTCKLSRTPIEEASIIADPETYKVTVDTSKSIIAARLAKKA